MYVPAMGLVDDSNYENVMISEKTSCSTESEGDVIFDVKRFDNEDPDVSNVEPHAKKKSRKRKHCEEEISKDPMLKPCFCKTKKCHTKLSVNTRGGL